MRQETIQGEYFFRAETLFSGPGTTCILIPPPCARQLDPALGKSGTDIRFPLRMGIGPGDFAIEGVPVLILRGNQAIHRLARGQGNGAGIAHGNQSVTRESYSASLIVRLELVMALLHALLEAGDRRRVDLDVCLRVGRSGYE